MDEKTAKKIEQQSTAIQIRAGIENFTRLSFIPEDVRAQINEELPKALPVLKDFVKLKIYELSQSLGTGPSKKVYLLKNGKDGPEFTIWKNMRAFDGDKEVTFPLSKILERIDKCDKIETLLAEVLSMKIFSLED